MKAQVHHAPEEDEYYFHEGCHILEVWNQPDDPKASLARARVAAGKTTRWHSLHGITERYYLLQGHGRVEVGEDIREPVSAGHVVVIPPDCAQRITNTGDEDLIFLAVCTPRFQPSAYQDLETDAPR